MIAVVLNAFAWAGSACILYAYARQEKTSHYHSLNIIGSFGLGAQCAYHGLYAQLLTNTLWAIVGAQALCIKNSVEGTDAESSTVEA